jgi:transcription elongation factor SPT4
MLCLLRHLLDKVEGRLGRRAAQFNNNGCENCPFLMMAGDSQRVMETTTVSYHGMVAVLDPTASWAAKWLHVGAPGRC